MKPELIDVTYNQLFLAAVAFGIIGNQHTKKDHFKIMAMLKKSKYAKNIRKGLWRIEFDD